jgi:anti-anti-sigma factor
MLSPLGDGKMSIISWVEQDEVAVITIEQTRLLDDANLRDLQKEVGDLVAGTAAKNVVLDFRRVDFVSSAGLGMLIRVKKRCSERNMALCLCGVTPTVEEAIRITGLNQLFQIAPDSAQAIAAFKNG